MRQKAIPDVLLQAAHDGQVTDLSTILHLDYLLFHWEEPHVTDGTPCFCFPDEREGVVIHRRLPWDPPQHLQGDA